VGEVNTAIRPLLNKLNEQPFKSWTVRATVGLSGWKKSALAAARHVLRTGQLVQSQGQH
jgi:hypothetical protein